MDYTFQNGNQSISIAYATTLPRLIKQLYFKIEEEQPKHIIVIANQIQYDYQYEFFSDWMEHENFSWYICPNSIYINNFEELENFLHFFHLDSLKDSVYLIALGNQGVSQLAGFLSQNSRAIKKIFVVTQQLLAVQTVLEMQATIFLDAKPALSCPFATEQLFYDSSIHPTIQVEERLEELCILMRLGFSSDFSFLQELSSFFKTAVDIQKRALTPFVTRYFQLLEQNFNQNQSFGLVYTKALQQCSKKHYMEKQNLEVIGICLQLATSQKYYGFEFKLDDFYKWLFQIGYWPVLPPTILSSDLVEKVMNNWQLEKESYLLKELGVSILHNELSQDHLFEIVESFRETVLSLSIFYSKK